MKQRVLITRRNPFPPDSFTEDEIAVSEILLDLPNLIKENELRESRSTLTWIRKRKRSSPSPGGCAPSTSPKSVLNANVIEQRRPLKIKFVFSKSPTTPLLLSHVEEKNCEKTASEENSTVMIKLPDLNEPLQGMTCGAEDNDGEDSLQRPIEIDGVAFDERMKRPGLIEFL